MYIFAYCKVKGLYLDEEVLYKTIDGIYIIS